MSLGVAIFKANDPIDQLQRILNVDLNSPDLENELMNRYQLMKKLELLMTLMNPNVDHTNLSKPKLLSSEIELAKKWFIPENASIEERQKLTIYLESHI